MNTSQKALLGFRTWMKGMFPNIPLAPIKPFVLFSLVAWFVLATVLAAPQPAGAQAADGTGQTIPLSAAPAATPITPPAPPTLVAPASGGMTSGANSAPLGMPTFVWITSADVVLSHIQVSNTPGFSTVLVDEDTQGTSYTPLEVWPDGPYYWRVKAAAGPLGNRVWGAYSEIAGFSKSWSHGGSIRPNLLQPQANAVRAQFAPTDFAWSPVAGAAGYLFEIAGDSLFTTPIYQAETVKPQHTPTKRFANSMYYWRVTPFAYTAPGRSPIYGAPSLVQAFSISWSTPPQQLAPEDFASLPFVPRFQWQAVEGAKNYLLEISTDVDFNPSTSYLTSNTDYTPTDALSNDREYFWRVKASDQNDNETPWSSVRRFRPQWNFAPELLTPARNQTRVSYPFFSWKPVPGAQQYQLQIDDSNEFNGTLIADMRLHNVTTYAHLRWDKVPLAMDGYWRVRAVDASGNYGPWSEIRSFRTDYAVSPNLIYPPPSYTPDAVNLPVHRVTTIAWPVFVWDTAHAWLTSALTATVGADYYEVMVDDDPNFASPNFAMQTRTLAAAPVLDPAHPEYAFDGLQAGKTFYWRVRAFINGEQISVDAISPLRYDRGASELEVSSNMTVLHPRDRYQAVGTPPVLGWQPVVIDGKDANNYYVEISRTPDFNVLVDSAHPRFAHYVPYQGKLTDMPAGTYWWRVRAETRPGDALTPWSEVRSFSLALDLIFGNPTDFPAPPYPSTVLSTTKQYLPSLTRVATSAGPTGDEYQLGDLHVMVDRSYKALPNNINLNRNWVFAFNINPSGGRPVRYGIYVDSNQVTRTANCGQIGPGAPDPGGMTDPVGQGIATYAAYAPEYVIYVDWDGSAITSVNYYRWNGMASEPYCSWAPAVKIKDLGGLAWFDPAQNAVELLVPFVALGGGDDDNSSSTLAVTLFSTSPAAGDGIRASIPPQAVLPGNTGSIIDNPVLVSDMLQPLWPFDTPLSNPTVFYDMPPLRWRMPIFDSVDGYRVQVARDERFTDVPYTWETWESMTNPFFAIMAATYQGADAVPNNESYYWRVQIRHEQKDFSGSYDYGPWSQPLRIKLSSREVGNPRLSTGKNVYMTPTFEWDRVEGAAGYWLQIATDSAFGTKIIDIPVDGTSYTPPESNNYQSLSSRTYYWRVAMRRSDTKIGSWTEPMTITKSSLTPTQLSPLSSNGLTLTEQPTFVWAAVLTPTETPRLAAPLYRIQVDDDPGFNTPAIDAATTATSYTPPKGKSLSDGKWYWRVAIYEATGSPGPYSLPQTFFKQYPTLRVLEPVNGAVTGLAPRFTWQGAYGAAYYIVEIAAENSFQNVTRISTPNLSYTIKEGKKNGKYFWRVQMVDQDGVRGPIIASRFSLGQTCYLPFVNRGK